VKGERTNRRRAAASSIDGLDRARDEGVLDLASGRVLHAGLQST
jgi:hypothetical protein